MEARPNTQAILQQLREQLDNSDLDAIRTTIHGLHPAEMAHLLESVPQPHRAVLWELVDVDDEGDILVEVVDEVRDGLIKGMQTDEIVAATDGMEVDDLADLLIDLPEAVTQQVLLSLNSRNRNACARCLPTTRIVPAD